MLAATIVRGGPGRGDSEAVRVRLPTTNAAAWQRSALLRGAEVALLGAPMPGDAGRDAAVPNLPARAVPDVPGRTRRSRRRVRVPAGAAGAAGRGGVRLRLSREPADACPHWPRRRTISARARPRSGARRVAGQAGRGRADCAADAGGAAALQRRAGGLRTSARPVISRTAAARRRWRRASSDRRSRWRRPNPGAHPAQRQGRADRA